MSAKTKEKTLPPPAIPAGLDATLVKASANLRIVGRDEAEKIREKSKSPVLDQRFEIRTPNAAFRGIRCRRKGFDGVSFNDGLGYTNDLAAANDCRVFGYVVTEINPPGIPGETGGDQ